MPKQVTEPSVNGEAVHPPVNGGMTESRFGIHNSIYEIMCLST